MTKVLSHYAKVILLFMLAILEFCESMICRMYNIKGHNLANRNLDEIDRRILRAVARDGRKPNSALADEVGLSTSPCWQRVKRLEDEGYIEGYAAVLNQEKLGYPEIVFVEVSLRRHDGEMLKQFGEDMARVPEILEVYLVSGDCDYLLKVAVSGTRGYEKFLTNTLYKFPYMRQSRSTFTLRCLKKATSVLP